MREAAEMRAETLERQKADLIARVTRMERAISRAQVQFEYYAEEHLKKARVFAAENNAGAQEIALGKMKVNADLAAAMLEVLK